VRPVAVFQFRFRHKIWAGHFVVLGRRNVGSGNCNQWKEVWPVTSRRGSRSIRQPVPRRTRSHTEEALKLPS
jgi:hypothetical protein